MWELIGLSIIQLLQGMKSTKDTDIQQQFSNLFGDHALRQSLLMSIYRYKTYQSYYDDTALLSDRSKDLDFDIPFDEKTGVDLMQSEDISYFHGFLFHCILYLCYKKPFITEENYTKSLDFLRYLTLLYPHYVYRNGENKEFLKWVKEQMNANKFESYMESNLQSLQPVSKEDRSKIETMLAEKKFGTMKELYDLICPSSVPTPTTVEDINSKLWYYKEKELSTVKEIITQAKEKDDLEELRHVLFTPKQYAMAVQFINSIEKTIGDVDNSLLDNLPGANDDTKDLIQEFLKLCNYQNINTLTKKI